MPVKFNLRDLELLGVVHPKTRSLFEAALEKSQLLPADYLSIRDLSGAGGFEDDVISIALLILLFENLSEGSLCLNLQEANLEKKWAGISKRVKIGFSNISHSLKKLTDCQCITADTGNVSGFPLVLSSNRLYFQKYYTAESAVKSILSRWLKEEENQHFAHKTEPEIIAALNDVCDNTLFDLNSLQLAAVCAGLTQKLLVISGGPGTGKTTTATALLRCLTRLGADPERIHLAAPTGRAANRLSESVRSQLSEIKEKKGVLAKADDSVLMSSNSTTLHSLLRYSPRIKGFIYNAENPLPADVVLVDELSMVDVNMMRSLLEALPARARLILMGDKDQLPSVEEGAVLESLMPGEYGFSQKLKRIHGEVAVGKGIAAISDNSYRAQRGPFRDKVVILETSIRNLPEIRDFALGINRQEPGLMDRLPVLSGPDFSWPVSGPKALAHIPRKSDYKYWKPLLEQWLSARFYLHEKDNSYKKWVQKFETASGNIKEECLRHIFKITEESRILTLTNQGREGKNAINSHLNQFLREQTDSRGGEKIFSGAPLIITTNSHPNSLYNGDTGVILKHGGEYRAWFRDLQNFRSLAMVTLPGWEPALAITVHKSQGSEYEHILMILPEQEEHRLLNQQIVYTGITRAKKTAVIYGSGSALDKAVAHRLVRESGLGEWL